MKTVSRNTPTGYTIFCDDIRLEASGKVTLVGIYAGELIVLGNLPTILPKFGIRIHYSERPGESDEPVELRIYLPGDTDETPTFKAAVPVETIREGPTPPEFEGLDPLRTAVIHAEFAPLPLKQEGLIKVRAYRGDLEIKLGSLKIRAQQAQQPEPAIPSDEISDLEIEKPN